MDNKVYLVADVETYGTDPKNGKLLGIALCFTGVDSTPLYLNIQHYDYKTSTWILDPNSIANLKYLSHLTDQYELIGHNYSYDKLWLDYHFKKDTKWHACTRLMWHMASAPSGPRPYGLKDAQIELLGWAAKGNVALNEQIKARGGKPGADIYLADKETIAEYARLDASSTAQVYNYLKPFFDENEYWWLLEKMVTYSWLLQECTTAGIELNTNKLELVIKELEDTYTKFRGIFLELAKPHITKLERIWRDDRATKYIIPAARERFLHNYELQRQFKLSSDKDKRELFYDILKLPVIVSTDGGKGSTGVEAIKMSIRGREDLKELVDAYEKAETAETLINNFAKPWLKAVTNNRLHPRFNPCGTVSYRLSGFKPYLLNAPFDQKQLMSTLKCDEGWVGLHADFASVEPCVTAHYSQDNSLLKVFKEGMGDVYLDLALTLFPEDRELLHGYSPNSPITSEIKKRFSNQRNVAKVIQLAVQYTGTKYTIQKNLAQAGFSMSLSEADDLVKAYWKHFHKVAIMNESLFRRYEKQGYLRNVIGRLIRVPTTVSILKKDGTYWEKPLPRYKDLPNRFIQSSAHDLLTLWVLKIAEQVKLKGLKAKSVILDCHDSTSWQCPKDEIEQLEAIFKNTLTELNEEVKMSVPVKIEMKRFTNLSGLKGNE